MKSFSANSQVLPVISVAFSLICTAPLNAQGSGLSGNNEIVKMVQASLPESVVIEKINQGANHWDTSIDALIALKRAGASDAEIKALAATTSVTEPPVRVTSPPPQPLAETPFMGGVLVRPNGRILLKFDPHTTLDRKLGPNPQLTFDVVLVDGHPALRLPVEGYFFHGKAFGTYYDEFGDLLITHDRLTYRPYAEGEAWKPAPWNASSNAPPLDLPLATLGPKPAGKAFGPNREWLGTAFAKTGSSWNLNLGRIFERKDRTPQGDFLVAVFSNFDVTMSALLEAAKSNDLSTPASPWPYTPPTEQQVNLFVQAHNASIGPQAPKSGNGWLSAMNAVQGIANMKQSMADAKVADASGNGAAQLNVALNAGRSEIDALGSVSNPASALAPTAPMNLPPPPAQSQPAASKAASAKPGLAYIPSKPPAATTPKIAANTGTAVQSNCVAVNVEGPCVPLTQYQQTQAQSQSQSQSQTSAVQVLCPASGFVPGVMIREGDTSVGVPCRPGTIIYPNGVPQYNTTGTTSATTSGSGANSSAGALVPVGTTVANPAQCHDMAFVVELDAHWTDPKKTEVVGFFTNHTISEVTCTWVFHRNGQWTDAGTGYIHAGAVRQGGEQGGVWTTGADSSSMKYVCYEGKDPVDVSGRFCNANLVFTGQTMAGTDK